MTTRARSRSATRSTAASAGRPPPDVERTSKAMPSFTVNPHRFDPYKNFKFRVKWDGRYVAGVSRVTPLRRRTQVVTHREGGDASAAPLARRHELRAHHARAWPHARR